MTDRNELIKKFNDSIEKILSVIKVKISQLIEQDVDIKPDLDTKMNLDEFYSTESPAELYLHIRSGDFQHSYFLDAEFMNTFYKWILKQDLQDESGTDIKEWLKETVYQIIEQLKQELPDIQLADPNFSDAPVPANTNPEHVPKDGLIVTYTVSNNDEKINIKHVIWSRTKGEAAMDTVLSMDSEEANVHPVEFEPFSGNGHHENKSENINMLMDVELEIQVELGRKEMLIKDILKLGKGSVVELDKAAGEALDIYVNGNKFAEGEVVVVDDQFGIRITHFQNYKESIKSLA